MSSLYLQILIAILPAIITGVVTWFIAKQKFSHDKSQHTQIEKQQATKDLLTNLHFFKHYLYCEIIKLEKHLGIEPSDKDIFGISATPEQRQRHQERRETQEALFQANQRKLTELLIIEQKHYPKKQTNQLKAILKFLETEMSKLSSADEAYTKYMELDKQKKSGIILLSYFKHALITTLKPKINGIYYLLSELSFLPTNS